MSVVFVWFCNLCFISCHNYNEDFIIKQINNILIIIENIYIKMIEIFYDFASNIAKKTIKIVI